MPKPGKRQDGLSLASSEETMFPAAGPFNRVNPVVIWGASAQSPEGEMKHKSGALLLLVIAIGWAFSARSANSTQQGLQGPIHVAAKTTSR
jgi:hypothetical protein